VGKDDTLFAKVSGLVSFREFKKGLKKVNVEPQQA
jgi:ribosomal protein L27